LNLALQTVSRAAAGRRGLILSKKKKEKKPEWKFFWKNVDGLGRINRMAAGAALLALAFQNKDEGPNPLMLCAGVYLLVVGFLRWCSLRALLRKPTKRAYLRHYPEAAEV
jgi:hypothetical protein